jgi:DNA replication and repair protein RecF
LIIGKNGIGKTNLLEAISYFAYGRSILHHHDEELINHSKDAFKIKAEYSVNDTLSEFQVIFDKHNKKVIHYENKQLRKLSDLYKLLQVVYSAPDDIFNLFTTPAKRRHFIDMAIAKIYPVYIEYLRNYKNALTQRNHLLKTEFNPKEKEAWDRVYCEAAFNIIEYRIMFFDLFNAEVTKAHSQIIDKDEIIDVSLKLNFYDNDFVSKMLAFLNKNIANERKQQTSLYGPHRDDFSISINKQDAFSYASQGQKRSIVIAFKIALANIIKAINNINPILIFDDTLAELDMQRSNFLLSYLTQKHQIFIASPSATKYNGIDLPVLEL